MTTPQPGDASQHQQYNGQHFQQTQPGLAQWNGSAMGASGAVQPPGSENANTDSPGSIREGKQKAKEAMAAARASPGIFAGQGASTANGFLATNDAPQLSRKRSRDGSQIPLKQSQSAQESTEDADGKAISHDPLMLDRYMQRDLLYAGVMNDHAERSRYLIKSKEQEKEFFTLDVDRRRKVDPGAVFGHGYIGQGHGVPNTNRPTQILYTTQRRPPKGRRSKEIRINRKDNERQAEQQEQLVPVRLDIELDRLRLRDTFTWNLHEKVISPDQFTDYLLEDLKLPPENIAEIARQVKAEMQDQIQNYYPHMVIDDGPLEQGRPYSEHKDDEMRIMIKLNITIGRITLVDQFEWDINNPLNSAEEFAQQMARENALSGEFTTAIAHSIREQSQLYTKSLWLTNHCFDGRPVEDPDVRDSFLHAPIPSAFRPLGAHKDWMPYMYEMSEAELERTETSMMREHRAQKRQLNRRGGPALPDLKDRQRTIRSLIVHSVIPGAVETWETTGIPKTRRGGRGARRGGKGADDEIESDDLESEASGAESPAPSNLNPGGTTRTRGMRGAASAAQAAMRLNYGRSATPDSQQLLAVQEPRISRRSMLREESVADDSEQLIIKLKIGKARFKAWWDDYRAKKRASEYPLSGYASQPPANLVNTMAAPRGGTPSRNALLNTPSMTPRPLPGQVRDTPQPNGNHRTPTLVGRQTQYDSQGRVNVDRWPGRDDSQPPPPPWLIEGITLQRSRYPESDFEPFMKPYVLNAETNDSMRMDPPLEPGAEAPEGMKLCYLPRIRCNDCPGKVYTALPGKVDDFEVHLKNKKHVQSVERRRRGG